MMPNIFPGKSHNIRLFFLSDPVEAKEIQLLGSNAWKSTLFEVSYNHAVWPAGLDLVCSCVDSVLFNT